MTSAKLDGVDDAGIAEALAEWPSPVRSSKQWEDSAIRTLAQLEAAEAAFDAEWDAVDTVAAEDEDVLSPPLPQGPDEPDEARVSAVPRERRSGSVSQPLPGRTRFDVALEEMEAAEGAEAADADTATEEIPESTLRTSTRPPPMSQAASVIPPPLEAPRSRRVPAPLIWVGALGLAAAASVFLFVHRSSTREAPAVAAVSPAPSSVSAPAAPVVEAPPAPVETPAPVAAAVSPEPAPARPTKKSSPTGAKKTAKTAKPPVSPTLSSNNMRIAAGATDVGSVPLRPANGAVQSALAASLPKARACLYTEDGVSRATLVFGSNGAVQTVSISGPAAGKPAESCIRSALKQTKLPPFAEPNFAFSTPIRPL